MTRTLVITLALVAGWVDAGSFVGLHHIMAAHITGNLVILAANIATGFHATDLLKHRHPADLSSWPSWP